MNRPRASSQAGRILHLLESAPGGKVGLPSILTLRISQSARIHDLRHRYGFRITNGCDPGRPDHAWFRLENSAPEFNRKVPDSQEAGLFAKADLERGAKWSDNG